jgi:hypothetical protein
MCYGSPLVEKTEFGGLVADGYVSEICEAHHSEQLSWAGCFEEEDLCLTEDGLFFAITKKPTHEASPLNRSLDFTQLTKILLRKFVRRDGMMPVYLLEFMNRVEQLKEKNGRALLVSLWILQHHPFLMGWEKWVEFLEAYYKWYKTMKVPERTLLLSAINRNIYLMWHLRKVRGNEALDTVYWSRGEDTRPDDFYTRIDWNVPRSTDNSDKVYPYTKEDGYLADFHRVVVVHGPEILGV